MRRTAAIPVLMVWLVTLVLLVGSHEAAAKGCLKGAAAGAVAGHVAGHHAVLGAVTGCAVGHHLAKKHQQQLRQMQSKPAQPGSASDPSAVTS